MPAALKQDERLHALCLTGAIPPADGPCVFTGRSAIYHGDGDCFDDGKGHVPAHNQPLALCDKTAGALVTLGREDTHVSPSTWFYDGGGCC